MIPWNPGYYDKWNNFIPYEKKWYCNHNKLIHQSEKEKAEYLKWLGFDVCAIDVGRDSYYLVMSGENYTLLDKMLKSIFPSCVIEAVTSHFSKRNNQQYILDIKVCISNFDDFYSLTKL